MCVIRQVGVRELRQNLSVYLREVAEKWRHSRSPTGDNPSLLTPLVRSDDPIDRLEARGLIARRATVDPTAVPPPLPARGGPTLSEILEADRNA